MTCPHTFDVAAYLLDALEPADANSLREHLIGCAACQPEYEQLRGLPTVLYRLPPSDVDDMVAPVDLPANLFDELLARAVAGGGHRTRRRVLTLAAAVATAGVGVITGMSLPQGNHAPTPDTSTAAATDPDTKVHASVVLTARQWGTQIRLRLSGVASAGRCVLLVSAADGSQDVAATWVARYRGPFDVTGTSAIPLRQIHQLDVITTTGQRLVSVPPPAR